MIGVWSPATLLHDPSAEIWIGLRTPGTEVAERVHRIRDAVPADRVPAEEAPWSVLTSVHSEGLLRHLRGVHEEWVATGYPQDRVVPYVFPTEAMLGGMRGGCLAAVHGRAGRYAYDTMTLVGPGTWEAAFAAASAAWTAARLVSSGPAYALCRPPGHHATRDGYGGSCYLNNAAVAATTLLAEGCAKVAVIDVDAHHGNGTQAIFWEREDVFYGSVHVDPGAGWFPHYMGFADETAGGTNLNVPSRRSRATRSGSTGSPGCARRRPASVRRRWSSPRGRRRRRRSGEPAEGHPGRLFRDRAAARRARVADGGGAGRWLSPGDPRRLGGRHPARDSGSTGRAAPRIPA